MKMRIEEIKNQDKNLEGVERRGFKNLMSLYIRSTRATLLVLFAVSAPLIIGAVGMALDISHAYLVKERLTHALDAAALAATAAAASGSSLEQRLNRFFEVNYPEHKVGVAYDLNYQINGDDVVVTAKAYYKTMFLNVLGVDKINVDAQTTVRREVRGLEVALVVDVTGSMQGRKIEDLRTASLSFVDIIFNRVKDKRFLKVGLVPYAATVNIGSIAADYVELPIVPARADVTYDMSEPTQWQGCVMARPYPYDTNDDSVNDGGYWDAFWWEHTTGDEDNNFWDEEKGGDLNLPYRNCNNRRTPNLGCPTDNPIVPLTNDEDTLVTAIEDIVYWCRGGTLGNLGMTWGWRVLSPEEPFNEGASYESEYWRKAVVMMTDGENQLWKKPGIDEQSDFSAYGYIDEGQLGTTNRGDGVREANERFAETCDMMKDKGIAIYTVTFGNSIIGKPSEQYYKDCASDESKYYAAANGDDLIAAFESISRELSNLHITN